MKHTIIIIGALTLVGHAATVNLILTDNTTDEPWFSNNGSSPYQGSILSGAGSSSNIVGSNLTIAGDATEGSGFTDGNGVPTGVIISFDMAFTLSANGNLTDIGNDGFGTDANGGNEFDPGDEVTFGTISLSNIVVDASGFSSGAYSFVSAGISMPQWYVVRSPNFVEASEGATIAGTGFGTSGSGVLSNNNSDGLIGPVSSFTATTQAGSWTIKGAGYQVTTASTVVAVPEPSGILLTGLSLGFLTLGRRRRRG